MEGDAPFTIDMLAGASDIDDGETATPMVASVAGLGPGITQSATTLILVSNAPVFNSLGVCQGLVSQVTYDIFDMHGAVVPQTAIISVNGSNDVAQPMDDSVATALKTKYASLTKMAASGMLRQKLPSMVGLSTTGPWQLRDPKINCRGRRPYSKLR